MKQLKITLALTVLIYIILTIPAIICLMTYDLAGNYYGIKYPNYLYYIISFISAVGGNVIGRSKYFQ